MRTNRISSGKGGLRRALADKSGVTALEFALISPILLVLMMAIIELGAIYIAESSLRVTTNNIARELRTGQIQSAGMNSVTFRNHFCDEMPAFLKPSGTCDSSLILDVEKFNNFSSAGFPPPINPDGTLNITTDVFNPGTACDVVLVRALYQWPVQTPVFLPFLVNMTGNKHLLAATSAFRNEPFTSAVEGC